MKVISVPLSIDAMNRLDIDSCIEGDLQELELKQTDYEQLWDTGIFENLNQSLGINIDDYEDEMIPFESLPNAIKTLENYQQNSGDIVDKLKSLMEVALSRKTGVFFFF